MENIFDDFNSIDWRTWDTFYAFDTLGRYWIENERIIAEAANIEELNNKPNWPPKSDEEIIEFQHEAKIARHLHDEIMVPIFRYSTVVMLYSLFESELLRLKQNVEKSSGKSPVDSKELKGGPTEQILRFLEAFYSINLKSINEFSKIRDIQKIRDCIVHCLGDVSISRDKDYLIKHSAVRSDLDIGVGYPIEISESYIRDGIELMWGFFIKTFKLCGWPVKDEWQRKQWAKTL